MGPDVPSEQVILATGGYDHTIRFWSAFNGQCIKTVQHPDSQVNAMEISPDRHLLAAAGYQHIRMYEVQGGNNPNPISTYEGVSKNITAVGFHEECRWMYSGGEDGSIRIWDLRTRNSQAQRLYPNSCPINCVTLHPNQTELISGDQNGNIHVWDIRNEYKANFTSEKDASILHLDIDSDGNYLAAVDNKGNCYMYRLKSSKSGMPSSKTDLKVDTSKNSVLEKRLKLQAHNKFGLKCKFSPDSTLLVTTSADHKAKIWRTADLVPLSGSKDEESSLINTSWPMAENISPLIELVDRENQQRWVWDVAFSLDSQYVITGSSDRLARLWSINSGQVIREYNGHLKAITAIAFSDGAAT